MKRFMSYTLIIALLACTLTVLWADIKKRNVNQYWENASQLKKKSQMGIS